MSNWREELRAAVTTPELREQEEQEKLQERIRIFYEEQVLPALYEIKIELEEQQKVVEVWGYPPGASLAVRDKETPRLDEFRYAVIVEDDLTVFANVAYLEAHSSDYTLRKVPLKPEGAVHNLTKDDVAIHFTRQYVRVHDKLVSENMDEFRTAAQRADSLEQQASEVLFSSTEIWKFLQKEI